MADLERLRAFVRGRVRQEADADDIVQETLARAQASPAVPERPEAWLLGIARRAVADHHRRKAPTVLLHDVAAETPPETVTAEVASWLRPMMGLLSEEDREALRLVDLDGLGQKELAERLGLSRTGAKSRVQRARRKLREILLECCDVERDRRGNALSYTPRACSCG